MLPFLMFINGSPVDPGPSFGFTQKLTLRQNQRQVMLWGDEYRECQQGTGE